MAIFSRGKILLGHPYSTHLPPSPQVIQMGMAIIFPFVLLSGILWPLIAMPDALRALSLALPATVPAEVARAVVLNQTLAVPNLALGFIIPAAWTAVNFGLCLFAVRLWGYKI